MVIGDVLLYPANTAMTSENGTTLAIILRRPSPSLVHTCLVSNYDAQLVILEYRVQIFTSHIRMDSHGLIYHEGPSS